MTTARPQFRLIGLMIVVLVVALALWLYRILGPPALVVVSIALAEVISSLILVRNRKKLAGWGFWIGSIAVNGWIAWLCTYHVDIGGGAMMAIAVIFALPTALGCGIAWARTPAGTVATRRKWSWVAGTLVLMMTASPISMMITLWPMKLAFLLSRPALNALADRVANGMPIHRPVRAGCYEVVAAKFDPGSETVALITDDDPAGRSGFIRSGFLPEAPQVYLFTNLNFDEHLDSRWRYQNED